MLRTQYVVAQHDGLWEIRLDGKYCGQYHSRRDALSAAIEAAHKAALEARGFNYPPRVLAESSYSREMQAEWTYGKDPYPPHL
jgi:hypothetical protein